MLEYDAHAILGVEVCGEVLGRVYRAVLASRASERHHEVGEAA